MLRIAVQDCALVGLVLALLPEQFVPPTEFLLSVAQVLALAVCVSSLVV